MDMIADRFFCMGYHIDCMIFYDDMGITIYIYEITMVIKVVPQPIELCLPSLVH